MYKRFFVLIIFPMFMYLCPYVFAAAPQRVLVVVTSGDSLSENIVKALKNVKVNFTCVDVNSAEIKNEIKKMGADDLLIVAVENISLSPCQSDIMIFLAGGGKVFFPHFGQMDSTLLTVAGVKNVKELKPTSGINIKEPLFPGIGGAETKKFKLPFKSFAVELDEKAKVMITNEEGSPLAWKYSWEKGQCIACISLLQDEKNYKGLMLLLASQLNDYFLTTIFNAKVVFIDDFPFPVPHGTEYVIASNYDGRNYEEFFKDIWWEDIKKMAVKYNLKYTCLALGGYENSVKMPPVLLSDRTKDFFRYYGNDAIKAGHEVGVHGYNHVSLLMADYANELKELGYPPWGSQKDMESSLRCFKQTLEETMPKNECFSYVPPMNMLSKQGMKAVMNVFPSIKCFAGLAEEPSESDRGILCQEFGPDPDFPTVYDLPRISSGYQYTEDQMFVIDNYIAYLGVFSHFIHPDDLMDRERSGNKNWQELYDDLTKTIGGVSTRFPFLRGMTAKEFVLERFRTAPIKVLSCKEGNVITISYENGTGPLYHYLKLNNGTRIKQVENGRFLPIGNIRGLYFLEGRQSPVKVILEP